MKKIALYLAGLLLTASCIYPFEPETPPVDRCLVFEGNLVIGESSTMSVRLLQPLSGSIVTDTDTWNINGEARVECTDGTVINGVPRLRGSNEVAFIFNLTNASAKEAYRVWFTDDETKRCTAPTG